MIPTVANLGVASHGLQLKGLDRNATQIPGFRGNLQSGDFCIGQVKLHTILDGVGYSCK